MAEKNAVASLLKKPPASAPAPTTAPAKKSKMFQRVGIITAVVVFIVVVAWFGGYIPGTNRNVARRGGYNKPAVRTAGNKVKWGEPGENDEEKRDFSIAIRDGTTPDEKLFVKSVYTSKTPEDRDEVSRWFISSHYGTSNPDSVKVNMFTSIIIDGADTNISGSDLDTEVQADMDVVEKAAELTKFEVSDTNKRLYNPETGMCLARDDGNTRGDGFKKDLVECGEATGFDIVGETLVAAVPGKSMCFPFNRSKAANSRISAASSSDAKEIYVSTHPCTTGMYDVKKDSDGYFVGVGPKCFMTDASGKNLTVSGANCTKKTKRTRFELKDKSEIVTGAGIQDQPGA
jgi:hypothetical protein